MLLGRVFHSRWLSPTLPALRLCISRLDVRRSLTSTSSRSGALRTADAAGSNLELTRNIGIIAHIDAGKTTTTERMLYYSGFTRRIGDVDEGSTVTDFLPAERERGITIQSAAITFYWPPKTPSAAPAASIQTLSPVHTINLIDTPGHADFTFEVIRSLRILDGAVCILDGVAGVEAQTEKVWNQANGYSIPRIIYVNKLDREGAAFHRTVKEIASRLHTFPALCQIPWWQDGKFIGIGDVVNLRALEWDQSGDGSRYTAYDWSRLNNHNSVFAQELRRARVALIEVLTEHDENMVETFLEAEEDFLVITPQSILGSLRNLLLSRKQVVTPVFLGASFRNIGVQPLLDAVNLLLPSPLETGDPDVKAGGADTHLSNILRGDVPTSTNSANMKIEKIQPQATTSKSLSPAQHLSACGLAFKVVNDSRRGMLVYVRVYCGSITRSASVYNTNLGVFERVPRLMRMYASEAVEIQSIEEGQIGVLAGLKHTRTGDTLIVSQGSSNKPPPAPLRDMQLRPITVPPPVFFTSVEPNSLAEEKSLNESVALLLREDPSLHVSTDPESGQTHLAGMGELHLEIARDRLINDYKVKASAGAIEISYRETIETGSAPCTRVNDNNAAVGAAASSCLARVSPVDIERIPEEGERQHLFHLSDNNVLVVRHPSLLRSGKIGSEPDSGSAGLPATLRLSSIVEAYRSGTSAALARGPKHAFPMHSIFVCIDFDPGIHLTPASNAANIAVAARAAVMAALQDAADKAAKPMLMEPVMSVSIAVPEETMGAVVHDLNSARGAQITSLDEEGDDSEHSTNPGWNQTSDTEERRKLTLDQLKRVYAPPDPYGATGIDQGAEFRAGSQQRIIRARVPLKEMVGYLKHLRSLTLGRGTFVMSVDTFETMNGQRLKSALIHLRGDFAV